MTHIAPADCYASPVKYDYRDRVWAAIDDGIGDRPRDDLRVAFLPAAKLPEMVGDADPPELMLIEAKGFRRERVIAINASTGIIAGVNRTWNKDRRVWTYRGEVGNVCHALADQGVVIDAANFDLCNKFSVKLLATLQYVAEALRPGSVIALTMVNGRDMMRKDWSVADTGAIIESGEFEQRLALRAEATWNADGAMNPKLAAAFQYLAQAGGFGLETVQSGEYKATSPMLFGVVRIS